MLVLCQKPDLSVQSEFQRARSTRFQPKRRKMRIRIIKLVSLESTVFSGFAPT